MDKFLINGPQKVAGKVSISGAKNAVLPIMASTIIQPAEYTIRNVPILRDTLTMIKMLELSGAIVDFKSNILRVDTRECSNYVAPYELVKTMRASFYMLGPFLSRFGKAVVSLPGGCAWGPRPVDYHIKAFEKMGATINLDGGNINAQGPLIGSEINFEQVSVGATGNVVMGAVKAKGETIILNPSLEPEIEDLCNFLKAMGAKISGLGTKQLIINGVSKMKSKVDYTIIPDRIEAGTFMMAAAISGGELELNGVNPSHLSIIINKLEESGTIIDYIDNSTLKVVSTGKIHPVDMVTAPYPGFPTDLQAQWMALMSLSDGVCTIIDEIYKDRFTHISELIRLGAKIKLNDNIATVYGVSRLTAAPVMSTDIRASASLIIACLSATGISEISRIYHIDRGYEKIEEKLNSLNIKIERIAK